MLKRVINAVIGSRHERERKKIQPIVDEINEHYARLHDVSEEELRAQTAKFRQTIEERTGELERRVAELKEQKRAASDIVERDRIDVELGGADGRGGDCRDRQRDESPQGSARPSGLSWLDVDHDRSPFESRS